MALKPEIENLLKTVGDTISKNTKEILETVISKTIEINLTETKEFEFGDFQENYSDSVVMISFNIAKDPDGKTMLFIEKNLASRLASWMMMEDEEKEFADENIDSIQEMVNQVTGFLRTSLPDIVGGPVEFENINTEVADLSEDLFNLENLITAAFEFEVADVDKWKIYSAITESTIAQYTGEGEETAAETTEETEEAADAAEGEEVEEGAEAAEEPEISGEAETEEGAEAVEAEETAEIAEEEAAPEEGAEAAEAVEEGTEAAEAIEEGAEETVPEEGAEEVGEELPEEGEMAELGAEEGIEEAGEAGEGEVPGFDLGDFMGEGEGEEEGMDEGEFPAEAVATAVAAGEEPPSEKLHMLLDLTMPISIELGRTKMLIKDILELGHGSVIEFDKFAGEPVDLLINDKKVAEGEIVVIDEHFGIKITSLVHPHERIKSLGG